MTRSQCARAARETKGERIQRVHRIYMCATGPSVCTDVSARWRAADRRRRACSHKDPTELHSTLPARCAIRMYICVTIGLDPRDRPSRDRPSAWGLYHVYLTPFIQYYHGDVCWYSEKSSVETRNSAGRSSSRDVYSPPARGACPC